MIKNSNLRGYSIPGAAERAVVQLSADDTTVYLHEQDRFEDLKDILDRWCLASGARCNSSKTEIIPFGKDSYREFLIATRRLNPVDEAIPGGIHIAKEGEAVRILGGIVGNGIDAFAVWAPILDKIDSDYLQYERWTNINPTMDMRKNIDQIVVGSRTQYLTQVNRMPQAVLKHVLNSQRELMNEGKSSMVSRDQLMAPRERGSLGMLDLEARNTALQMV
ncbi:hypothetical protein K438DRAFT_1599014, partial [Mycena galopus ATCC 62051]